ncbi:MAG: adenylate/guanylate cyclase domain-containing protein [Candidatus Ozemobacteraceae bacterium]
MNSAMASPKKEELQANPLLVIVPKPFSPLVILLLWLFIVFLPVVALERGMAVLLDMTKKRALDQARSDLLQETTAFARDLDPGTALTGTMETLLSPYIASSSFFETKNDVLGNTLMEGVKSRLGGRPLMLFIAGPDLRELRMQCDAGRILPGSEPPKRVILSWMRQWAKASGHRSVNESMKQVFYSGDIPESRIEGLVKSVFGADILPRVASGFTSRLFSFKFRGPMHIYARLLTAGSAPDAPILGGVAVVMLDRDLSGRSIAWRAVGRPRTKANGLCPVQSPHVARCVQGPFRRGIRRSILRGRSSRMSSFQRFKRLPGGIALEIAAPARFVIRTQNADQRQTLKLRVELRGERLDSPLKDLFGSAMLLLRSLVLVAFILLLRIRLLDRPLDVSLRARLFTALVAGVGIPLAIFLLALLAWNSAARRMETLSTFERLRRGFELMDAGLISAELQRDHALRNARKRFREILAADRPDFLPALRDLAKAKVLESAIILSNDGTWYKYPEKEEQCSDIRFPEAMSFFRPFMTRLLVQTKIITPDEARRMQAEKKEGSATSAFASEMFDEAEMNTLIRDERQSWQIDLSDVRPLHVRGMLISAKSPSGKVRHAVIAMIFDRETLAREFFREKSKIPADFRDFSGEYETRTAIFPVSSQTREVLPREVAWPPLAATDKNLTALGQRALSSHWTGTEELQNGTLIAARFFLNEAFLGVGIARPRHSPLRRRTDFLMCALAIGYVLLLMRLTATLLETVFSVPLSKLIEGIRRVRDGDLGYRLSLETGDEFTEAAKECGNMSRALLERERMSRFVSAFAIEDSARTTSETAIGNRVTLTILFSHVRGFDRLTEKLPPEEIVEFLNAYFSAMERAVVSAGGVIDKFIGDAVMAVFHPGHVGEDHAVAACRAAVAMRAALASLNVERVNEGRFPVETGIGIAVGSVIAGRVGSTIGRVDATVIGEAVNLAARVEAASEKTGTTGILVCPETARLVQAKMGVKSCALTKTSATSKEGELFPGGEFSMTSVGPVPLKGITEPVELFEMSVPEASQIGSLTPRNGFSADGPSSQHTLNGISSSERKNETEDGPGKAFRAIDKSVIFQSILPWRTLGLIWFIAFFIPVIFLRYAFDSLVLREEVGRRERVQQGMLREMRQFRADLEVDVFLKNRFDRLFAFTTAFPSTVSSSTAYSSTAHTHMLLQRIRSEIGCYPEFLVFSSGQHGAPHYFVRKSLVPAFKEAGGGKGIPLLITLRAALTRDASYGKIAALRNASAGERLLTDMFGPFGALLVHPTALGISSVLVPGLDDHVADGGWISLSGPTSRKNAGWVFFVIRRDRVPRSSLLKGAKELSGSGFRRTLRRTNRFTGPAFFDAPGGLTYIDTLPMPLAGFSATRPAESFRNVVQGPDSRTSANQDNPLVAKDPLMLAVVADTAFHSGTLQAFQVSFHHATTFLLLCSGFLVGWWAVRGQAPVVGISTKIAFGMLLVVWIPVVGISLVGLSLGSFQQWVKNQEILDEMDRAARLLNLRANDVEQITGTQIGAVRRRLEEVYRKHGNRAVHQAVPRLSVGRFVPNIILMTDDARFQMRSRGGAKEKSSFESQSKDALLKIARGLMLEFFLKLGAGDKVAPTYAKLQSIQRFITVSHGIGDSILIPSALDHFLTFPCEPKAIKLSTANDFSTLFPLYPRGRRGEPPFAFLHLTFMFEHMVRIFWNSLLREPGDPLSDPPVVNRSFAVYYGAKTSRMIEPKIQRLAEPGIGEDLKRMCQRDWLERTDERLDEPASRSTRFLLTRRFPDMPLIMGIQEVVPDAGIPIVLMATLAGSLLAIFTAIVLAASTTLLRPIRACLDAVRQTASGRFAWRLDLGRNDEIGRMAEALNEMIEGVRRRERLKRFVSEDVLAAVSSDDERLLEPGGERVEATVLFSDIRAFTVLSAQHPPEEVVTMLNAYFTRMERCIRDHGGNIDKFIGDALLAVFRDQHVPGKEDDRSPSDGDENRRSHHAMNAARAALAMRKELVAFNQKREEEGRFTIHTGIGLASGSVVSGRIGSASGAGRLDFTVVGKIVNQVSGLEAASKHARKTGIVVSEQTRTLLEGEAGEAFQFLPMALPKAEPASDACFELY